MSRRLRQSLLVSALLIAAASPAMAADKVVPASRALPFLENYLKLPPAERSHFTMAYYLRVGGQPLTAPVWLVQGERRTRVPISPKGKVERLPTLAELAEGQLSIGVDSETKVGTTFGLEPLLAPAADLDAKELAAAVAQATVGQRKIAGVMALAMPKLKDVEFVGVPSGEVEFADGRRAPLPLTKGVPTYDPAVLANAKRIHLPKVPDKLDIN